MSQTQEDTEVAIIQLVAHHTGVASNKISVRTRLGEDLGIDGDDATELLSDIASRFGVDFSRLRFDRHFGPEGSSFPPAITKTRSYPLLVQDLVDAAKSGTFTYDYEHRSFATSSSWYAWIMFLALVAMVAAAICLLR